MCGVRSRCFRCSKGGGPRFQPTFPNNRTPPRLQHRIAASPPTPLTTRPAMMIDVPSLPNTQGHQGLPVVSLAFVGVAPPTDPQAVQE